MAQEPLDAAEEPAAKRRPSRRIRQWLFLLTLVATLPFAILTFIQSATELGAMREAADRVLVGTPTAIVFAPMRRFIVVQSAILLAVLAMFVALTILVARRIEQPIVALAQRTRQLMHSSAKGMLPEEGPAEIALLAHSFNDMLSAHYRDEERVRENEARIQSIFSSAMDAIITADEQQRIVLFNAAAESMFGISAAEARERPLSAFMPERFRAQHASHVQRFGDGNQTQRGMGNIGAVYGLRASGEEFPIEASISQVSLGGGKLYTVILRDITGRLRAEQAIQESESRIAAALDASGSAAWDLDLRTGAFRHDDAFAAMLDLPRGALVRTQEEVRSFVHPEDRTRVVDTTARVIRGENDRLEIEFRNVTRTGRLIWVVAAARVVERDGAGLATRMVGSTREITEKKHAQFRLEQETEFNRTLVNASPAFFVAVNPAGRIVVINDSMLTALGYERDELLNHSFEIIMAARNIEEARHAFRVASESLEAFTVEGILQTRDGREVVVDWRARPVLNESGRLEFVFAIGIDAGERRKQELARERYTELLAAVNETAITLLSHHDVEETLRMIATRAAALTGAAGSYVAMHDRERHVLRVVAAGGISAPYIGREIEPGNGLVGRVYDIRQPVIVDDIQKWPGRTGASDIHAAAAVPILSGDEVLGALGIAETIPDKRISTEQVELLTRLAQLGSIAIDNARLIAGAQREVADRTRAEEEVRRLNLDLENRVRERTAQLEDEIADRVSAQTALQERGNELAAANLELAAAARMKDEFLANMSHELRTPLNAVLGMAEVLREGIHGPLNPRQESSLQIITDSGTHLLELINDVLDLSKVEAGKIELDLQPSRVRSVADASLAMVRESAFRKQLTLELDIDPGVEMIDADERRLKQILMNLLSNAVKFTPANGSVGLQVTGNEEANEIRFTVWDTGIGIAGSEIPRLFTPFFQADSSFTRQYSGTGLGLTLVRRFAALHGGSVDVTSIPGEGSRFCVVLPWRHAGLVPRLPTAVLQEPAPRSRRGLQTHTRPRPLILVAEDNETNIHLMESYLGALEMDVIVARDGAEAVAAARQSRPDLILMDVQMPMVDGLEATRIIREAGADMNTIPIIAVTALAMPGDKERCLAAGADGFLTKPVSHEALEKAIGKLLGSSR